MIRWTPLSHKNKYKNIYLKYSQTTYNNSLMPNANNYQGIICGVNFSLVSLIKCTLCQLWKDLTLQNSNLHLDSNRFGLYIDFTYTDWSGLYVGLGVVWLVHKKLSNNWNLSFSWISGYRLLLIFHSRLRAKQILKKKKEIEKVGHFLNNI